MNSRLLFILMLFFRLSINAWTEPEFDRRAILFGERRKLNCSSESVYRVFIDKNGYYYPDVFIADKTLRATNGELKTWYIKYPKIFDSLCESYKMAPNKSLENKIGALNDSICSHLVRKINIKKKDHKTVCVNIHGYRKKAYGKSDKFTSTSIEDNRIIQRAFEQNCPDNFFIEIYWDSRYIRPIHTISKKSLKIFETDAIPVANNVGLSLRKLIGKINTDYLNVVTHSLGARVAANLLFNVTGCSLELMHMTPEQKYVKIYMIAPAIGVEMFENYYKRGDETIRIDKVENYTLAVAYNPQDVILQKSYKLCGLIPILKSKPTEFGNTSLGCDYDFSIEKLKSYFKDIFIFSQIPITTNCYNSKAKKEIHSQS